MDSLIIRQTSDAGLLTGVIAGSFADVAVRFSLTRDNCPGHTSFITADEICKGMQLGSTFYAAFSGGSACGCVGVRQPRNGACVIEKLAVLPACRRHGVGRALMEHAFAAIRASGAGRAEIGIIEEHRDLRSWYETLGFLAVRSARYEHLPFGVLHMEKVLITTP